MQDSKQVRVRWRAWWRTLDIKDMDGRSTLMLFMGAVLIWTVGLLTINILPLVFQTLKGRDGIGESELGTLGASFILGTVLVTGSSPLWIQKTNSRVVTVFGLVASAGGFVASSWVSSFHGLLICYAAIGAGAGLIQIPAYAVIGSARNPVRAFGIAMFVSMVLPAILSFSLSAVQASGGEALFFWIVAAVFVATIPLAGALPGGPLPSVRSHGQVEVASTPSAAARSRLSDYGAALAAPVTASIAGGLFSGVIMAVYNFVGSVAVANGLPVDVTGPLVGFGLLSALVGSLLPTIVDSWIRPTVGLALTVALLVLVAYPAMLSASSGVFTAGFIIECVLGTAGFAYFFAMVRSIDPTDQIYVGYTAFQSVGIAGATFAAGVLLNNFGPVVMLTAAGACLVASLFIWLLALRLSVRFPA
jgi:hypothetical protein